MYIYIYISRISIFFVSYVTVSELFCTEFLEIFTVHQQLCYQSNHQLLLLFLELLFLKYF